MNGVKKSLKKIILISLIAIVLAVALFLSALLVSNSVSQKIVDENVETIREMAHHDAHSVVNSLTVRYQVLSGIADSMKKSRPADMQELQLMLQDRMPSVAGAKEIFLVDDEGQVYKATGLITYRPEVDALCDAHTGCFTARYNRPDSMLEMRRELLLLAAPADFSMGETHFRYIVATMNIETLSTELKIDSYGGQGYSSIVDEQGNYIVNVNKKHSFLTYDNFFEDMSLVQTEKHTASEMLAEAAASGSCTDIFESEGERFVTVVSGLTENGWYQVSTVPMRVFEGISNGIMDVIYILLTVVIAVLLIVALLVGRGRKQRAQLAYVAERAKDAETIKEQNLELAEKQQALNEALELAQSANRAKTTFLNNMSHDIRTPMNAIIGYTGLATTHIDNKEQVRDYLGKISQSSEHLLSLINDVLDMSRIESGKMNLNEKDEDLGEILHTLRNIVQADINGKQFDFFIDTDVTHQFVVCDKLRLNQVLLNILSNSIKYTQAGGTISVRLKENGITHSGYGKYEFRIKDNGMGMSEDFLKTIYDPFTRVKNSTVSGIQGTGLGMAITRNIVEMMGGTIDILSKEGEGTETILSFEFRLTEGNTEPVRLAHLEGLRSLVVDDDIAACRNISKMLHDAGMRSEWCASGKEAVLRTEDALSLGDLYKVYIIDWIMPDMNGIETTRRIRQVVGDEAPIIVLTAYDWSDIEVEAKEAGVTAFVSKPLFPSDLRNVLNSCCGEKASEAAPAAPEYDFTGKKILLVEDNEMNREIATEILEEEGFIVDTAEDGTVAVAKMQAAQPGKYDLILMDVQMPIMNGYEATRAIRALPDPAVANITILAMTANAFEEDRQEALKAGMNEHLSKPIEIDKLKATLARFLK